MKRVFSLFFLVVILLNTIGYYGILLLVKERHYQQLTQRIDENEHEISGSLILRIPVKSSGQQQTGYNRTKGEIVYQGDVYHFIKSQIYNDTLYVICLNNKESTEIQKTITEFSKSFAGQPQESGFGRKLVASFGESYILFSLEKGEPNLAWCRTINLPDSKNLYQLEMHSAIFHPPTNA